MSKGNNYNIRLLDEGYEDKFGQKIHNIKKEFKEALLCENEVKSKSKYTSMKKLGIICLWIYFYRLFINWGFGIVYIMFSIIILIFSNLGKRKPWQLSAYSVFNPNFERIPGTFTANDIYPGVNSNVRDINNNSSNTLNTLNNSSFERTDPNDSLVVTAYDKRKKLLKENKKQPLNSVCNCGSNLKFKKCCALKSN